MIKQNDANNLSAIDLIGFHSQGGLLEGVQESHNTSVGALAERHHATAAPSRGEPLSSQQKKAQQMLAQARKTSANQHGPTTHGGH